MTKSYIARIFLVIIEDHEGFHKMKKNNDCLWIHFVSFLTVQYPCMKCVGKRIVCQQLKVK